MVGNVIHSIQSKSYLYSFILFAVENNEGGGGQKNIVVYCPYWIVNSTQYIYRIREEGEIDLPAGTKVNESK
jgi:hypothetical protein